MDKNTEESKQFVNGVDLLKLASKVSDRNIVVYFLPKNMNEISLGRAAYRSNYRGLSVELERNVLNGKLKTVTAFIGPDCSSLNSGVRKTA